MLILLFIFLMYMFFTKRKMTFKKIWRNFLNLNWTERLLLAICYMLTLNLILYNSSEYVFSVVNIIIILLITLWAVMFFLLWASNMDILLTNYIMPHEELTLKETLILLNITFSFLLAYCKFV